MGQDYNNEYRNMAEHVINLHVYEVREAKEAFERFVEKERIIQNSIKDAKLPILIFARNAEQADNYAKYMGLQRKNYKYVSSLEKLFGFRNCSFVRVGNWYDRRDMVDLNRLEHYCITHNISILPDIE